jgi:hypothetical protein
VIQFEMPAGKDREELEMELIDAGLKNSRKTKVPVSPTPTTPILVRSPKHSKI